jgi:hypothetical protein
MSTCGSRDKMRRLHQRRTQHTIGLRIGLSALRPQPPTLIFDGV